ncbi:MAG: hypothetical protein GY832_23375 [Chloroflexi bacterium]|nr:hypothetical protein [Chloroflexota bacterium]
MKDVSKFRVKREKLAWFRRGETINHQNLGDQRHLSYTGIVWGRIKVRERARFGFYRMKLGPLYPHM